MSKAIVALTLLILLLGCSQASVPDKRPTLTVRPAYGPISIVASLEGARL